MSLSQRKRRELHQALGRAYYTLALCRTLAEEQRQAGIASDLDDIIRELLRVRVSLYSPPDSRGPICPS